MKLTSDLLSLSPLGHSDGFASCKAWRVLISASLPKTPFPRERLCMLGWLCIVQSPCAYTPGIRAGGEYGDWRPCDLPRGYAPNPVLSRIIKNIGLSTVCAIRYVRTAMCKALYQPINSFISEFSGTASGGTSFISDRNLGNSL